MALVFKEEITNAGLALTYDPQGWGGGDAILFLYTSAPVTLGADIDVTLSTPMGLGKTFTIINVATDVTRNGRRLDLTLSLPGSRSVTDDWEFLMPFVLSATNVDDSQYATGLWFDFMAANGGMDGNYVLLDGSVPLAKLVDLTAGRIILGDAANRPTETALSGDIAITSAGVTSISAGVIVNADINAAAAIALSKLAALTASKVAVTDGSGIITTANQLSALLGGNGIDNSAATGFPVWTAGSQSVGAIGEQEVIDVSFEAAAGVVPSVGDFKIKMGYAGTVTNIYAYATKAIAATDVATITPKDNAGTTMTVTTPISFAAADVRGTAYSSAVTANNTFIAGDILTLTSAKTTAGGWAKVTLSITRTS